MSDGMRIRVSAYAVLRSWVGGLIAPFRHTAAAVPKFRPTDRSQWRVTMARARNAAGRGPGARRDNRTKTVTRMWRTGWTGTGPLVALVALGLAAGARAQTVDMSNAPRALASNGVVVVMPKIAELDCAGMSQVLRRIDLSNYRGPDPVSEGHPDWPIFEYEDRLSGQIYFSCTLGENRLEDPGTAFSFGFESQ